jgi:hypothetical protein
MKSRTPTVLAALLASACFTCAFAQVEEVRETFRKPQETQELPLAPYRASAVKQKWDVAVTDITLAKALDRWAAKAGWRVRWDADRHVLISAPAVYEGSFEDAVAAVLATPGIRGSAYPLEACVYANTPPLIRVTRMGDQVNECPNQ